MKTILLAFCLIVISAFSYAQTISGYVKDAATKEAIPFASIKAKLESDSSTIALSSSDEKGYYILKLQNSNRKVFIEAKAFGYRTVSKTYEVGQTEIQFLLESETKSTATTSIVAQKNPITRTADKTEVDVENTASYNGLSALEILRRVPGVQVDNQGNVSLMGKSQVQIMIDDRIMNLSTAELASLLKGMPASQLKKIELMTQPGAKYDAEGTGGIVHLVTKKGLAESFRSGGSITQGQGFYPKHNSSIYASYGNKKITMGSSYSYVENLNRERNYEERNFIKPEGTTTQGYTQEYKSPESSHTLKNDFSASLGNGHRFTGSYLLSRNVKVSNGGTKSYLISPDGAYSPSRTTDYNPDATYSHQMEARYDWKPDSSKHHFVVAADYVVLRQISKQNFGIVYDSLAGATQQRLTGSVMYNPIRTDLFIPRIDYTYSATDSLKFEMGVKANILDLNNDVSRTNTYLKNGSSSDSLSPSRYSYKEQVLAAYFTTDWKKGKMGMNLGLRAENWYATGLQKVNGASFVRNQFQLFPSLALSYQATPATQYLLKLNRRIDRPSYNMLNPYTFLMDAYTRWKGNPMLLPSLSNNVEVGVNFLYGLAGVTLSASQTSNPVIEYAASVETDTNYKTALQPQNLQSFKNLNLNGYFSPDITKWWHLDFFGMVYNNQYFGQYFGANASNGAWAVLGNLNQRITLGKGWQTDIDFEYIGPSVFGILKVKKLVMFSVGVQKTFWKEQCTLRLQGQNILNSFHYTTSTDTPNLKDAGDYSWDNQLIQLSFSWKLGKLKAQLPESEKDTRLGKSLGR